MSEREELAEVMREAKLATFVFTGNDGGLSMAVRDNAEAAEIATDAALSWFRARQVEAAEESGTPISHPGRWWQVIAPDGSLWCETSDEAEARRFRRPGDTLRREWVTDPLTEWREVLDE